MMSRNNDKIQEDTYSMLIERIDILEEIINNYKVNIQGLEIDKYISYNKNLEIHAQVSER